MDELPEGWTIERIEAMGVRSAKVVSNDRDVLEDRVDDYAVLDPVYIIDCGGLCLVLDRSDREWHMGQMDDDGSIICWGSYGNDLGRAIEGL